MKGMLNVTTDGRNLTTDLTENRDEKKRLNKKSVLLFVWSVWSVVAFLLASPAAYAQEAADTEDAEAYRLPETEVSAETDTPEYVSREEMDRDGARDLQEAVRYVPGVILSGGGRRNDSNFTIRGFGIDSVPIFVDG
ncbi:MAG: TonB-dependent receptor plug domain-containing protein, partial [Treponema sp.]|nr:TonB-dependent receptor plug domain-containing protein [Treponema sp.]